MRSLLVRPAFALSSRSSPFMRHAALIEIARVARLDGADLDAKRLDPAVPAAATSIWLPKSLAKSPSHVERWLERLELHLAAARDRVVVVLPLKFEHSTGRPASQAIEIARRLREAAGDDHRIAFGLEPATHGGGRGHLDRIRMLRSVCGEWDVWMALDLVGANDWQWEAEAAVFHAAPRLALLRVEMPPRTFDAHVHTRITERSLRASVDSGFAGVYAIAPPLLPWRWWDRAVLAGKAEAAAAAIRALMRADNADDVPGPATHHFPPPRRGHRD